MGWPGGSFVGGADKGTRPRHPREPAEIAVVGVHHSAVLDRIRRQLGICREIASCPDFLQKAERYVPVDVGQASPIEQMSERNIGIPCIC